jgi:hypothetical protein
MFDLVNKSSFEWASVENAVEVYKLPAKLKWPTMYCEKQTTDIYKFPEFMIRRMNVLHRHRVNATMNRLWYRPDDDDLKSGQMVVWAGSPGCGKTIAVNEIILECILKLQDLATADRQTKWQFFLRNRNTLSRYYFDAINNRVSHQLYTFRNEFDVLAHVRDAYVKNLNSFVIYEMNENEVCPVIEMPFLLSTSCRDLEQNIKGILKTESHTMYLYDPMLHFEFRFFLDVCFAFGDFKDLGDKDMYRNRFQIQGGVLRKLFARKFSDPVPIAFSASIQKESLVALALCSPLNLNTAVNAIVGAYFKHPVSYEEDIYYKSFRKETIESDEHFFPAECIPYEYFHLPRNWCVKILSDRIALAIGECVKFPADMANLTSVALYQVQELMHIYGGILKKSTEFYVLPERFRMTSWTFYKCSSNDFDAATKKQQDAKKLRVYTSIFYAEAMSSKERSTLIEKLPMTSAIWTFSGQYLDRPFQELSSDNVYRCLLHNSPVYDALTANPKLKQLFLFQSTLLDPQDHPINISVFNEVLLKLRLTESTSVDEINFFMIISAHDPIKDQHYFSFELGEFYFNACYLHEYASEFGLSVLKKVIIMNPDSKRYVHDPMTTDEIILISKDEIAFLSKIGGCCESKGNKRSVKRLILPKALYQDLFTFLGVASKINSYICRAAFTASKIIA